MSDLDRMVELARRKERLIARAAAQRAGIAAAIGAWETPIGVIDRGLEAVRYLRAHPLALAALVAAVVLLRRRNLIGWLGRGFTVWRAWRMLSAWSASRVPG